MTYRKQRSYKWRDMRVSEAEMRQTVSCLAAPVREQLRTISKHTLSRDVREAAAALAVYLSRRNVRLKYDHERDTRTRVLIGGRYSRWLADQVKEAAAAQGRSVYAWLQEAIVQKLERDERRAQSAAPAAAPVGPPS